LAPACLSVFRFPKSDEDKLMRLYASLQSRCCALHSKVQYATVSSHSEKTFDKILIANRGEIACRMADEAGVLALPPPVRAT
ncbi:hypothetical protein INR49_016413, partial [Caranx melampygus]